MPDDYNCLFTAVSDQLYGTIEHANQIRMRVVDWLRQSRDRIWVPLP